MTRVRADGLVKRYGIYTAVDKITIHTLDGEFVTLLGLSGYGKSTTLRMLAGLIQPDEGGIFFDGKDATDLSPDKRTSSFNA